MKCFGNFIQQLLTADFHVVSTIGNRLLLHINKWQQTQYIYYSPRIPMFPLFQLQPLTSIQTRKKTNVKPIK